MKRSRWKAAGSWCTRCPGCSAGGCWWSSGSTSCPQSGPATNTLTFIIELRAQSWLNSFYITVTDSNVYQQSHKHTSLSWKGLERMVRLPSSIGSWKREGMCSSWSFSYEYLASLYAPSFRLCLASAYKVFLIMGWRKTHVGGILGCYSSAEILISRCLNQNCFRFIWKNVWLYRSD